MTDNTDDIDDIEENETDPDEQAAINQLEDKIDNRNPAAEQAQIQAQAQTPQPINPAVAQYLQAKYFPDSMDDKALAAAQANAQAQKSSPLNAIASLLYGVGSAASGKGDTSDFIKGVNSNIDAKTVNPILQQRAAYMQSTDEGMKAQQFAQQQKQFADANDPNSALSQVYQEAMSKLDPNGDYSSYSAADLQKITQPMEMQLKAQDQLLARQANNQYRDMMVQDKLQQRAKLPESDTNQISTIDSARNSVQGLIDRAGNISSGPVAGRYEEAKEFVGQGDSATEGFEADMNALAPQLSEALGSRNMKASPSTVNEMLPKMTDEPDIIKSKLQAIDTLLANKKNETLNSLQKAGKNVDEYRDSSNNVDSSSNNSTAHPQDNQALAWAQANPNDPRAKAILQHLNPNVASN